jgi:hypothetical protein
MNNKLHGGQRRCPHDFEISNHKLLKNVPQQQKLNAYESIFLHKARSQRLMYDERQKQGNIVSSLYSVQIATLKDDQSSHKIKNQIIPKLILKTVRRWLPCS